MQHLRVKFVLTILVANKMEIRNSLNDQHKKQTSCQILLLGTNLGSLLWAWDEISVLWMSQEDMLIAFLTIWMTGVCLCKTNSEFHFLGRSFEACDRCQEVEKARRTDRQLDVVPQQWSMSHIPHNTALFNDKPNSNHPPQPLDSPDLTLCNFWLLLTSRLAFKVIVLYLKKKFNRTWQQVSQPYQKMTSSGASHNGTRAGTM